MSRHVLRVCNESFKNEPTRLLCPWDSPGKNTGVGSHSLLQGIFLTQRLNPGLLNCKRILYSLSNERSLPNSIHMYKSIHLGFRHVWESGIWNWWGGLGEWNLSTDDGVLFAWGRRWWQPTPVTLPGKSHGWRSLEGCSPWGRAESDTTEAT